MTYDAEWNGYKITEKQLALATQLHAASEGHEGTEPCKLCIWRAAKIQLNLYHKDELKIYEALLENVGDRT